MISSRETTEDVRNLRPLIQQLLDEWCKKHRTRFALKVSKYILEQDGWTFYTVIPDREGIPSFEYAPVLAEAGAFLEREKHEENVMLLPTVPGESALMGWTDE